MTTYRCKKEKWTGDGKEQGTKYTQQVPGERSASLLFLDMTWVQPIVMCDMERKLSIFGISVLKKADVCLSKATISCL